MQDASKRIRTPNPFSNFNFMFGDAMFSLQNPQNVVMSIVDETSSEADSSDDAVDI